MLKKPSSFILIILLAVVMFALLTLPVLAQGKAEGIALTGAASTAGFLLLLPFGLLLFIASALPQAETLAPQAATTALVVWGVAGLAYFAVGFAFQFGGLGVYNPHPDFSALNLNWSPLVGELGQTWGVIGLRGAALLGPAATLAVYDLFLRHLAFVGVVAVVPTFILFQRARTWVLLAFGLLTGSLIYPLAGNWLWSGGWLANLGQNQGLGHGFVDAGLSIVFVITGVSCLTALALFKNEADEIPASQKESFIETPMPSAYLPMLSIFGLGLVLWSWAFIANVQHIPTAVEIAMPRAALNGLLSAISALLVAGLYSRFTTAQFNPLMTMRGGLAGLVIVGASAPFIPPWQALALGALAGFLTPLLIYLVDNVLRLQDFTAGIAVFGSMGLLSWLAVGLLADGSSGAGWNTVGPDDYLGVAGQGVSGLVVAAGYVSDGVKQLNAQLLGGVTVIVWTALITTILFGFERWLLRRKSTASQIESDESTLPLPLQENEDEPLTLL